MEKVDEEDRVSGSIVIRSMLPCCGYLLWRLKLPRKYHELKTEMEYYQAIERGDKTFEVRKNDRNFQKYDMVILKEVVNGIPTGRKLDPMEIIYILPGGIYGIAPDYCVMQLKR